MKNKSDCAKNLKYFCGPGISLDLCLQVAFPASGFCHQSAVAWVRACCCGRAAWSSSTWSCMLNVDSDRCCCRRRCKSMLTCWVELSWNVIDILDGLSPVESLKALYNDFMILQSLNILSLWFHNTSMFWRCNWIVSLVDVIFYIFAVICSCWDLTVVSVYFLC